MLYVLFGHQSCWQSHCLSNVDVTLGLALVLSPPSITPHYVHWVLEMVQPVEITQRVIQYMHYPYQLTFTCWSTVVPFPTFQTLPGCYAGKSEPSIARVVCLWPNGCLRECHIAVLLCHSRRYMREVSSAQQILGRRLLLATGLVHAWDSSAQCIPRVKVLLAAGLRICAVSANKWDLVDYFHFWNFWQEGRSICCIGRQF